MEINNDHCVVFSEKLQENILLGKDILWSHNVDKVASCSDEGTGFKSNPKNMKNIISMENVIYATSPSRKLEPRVRGN